METKFLSERVKGFENLLKSKENYDMIIDAGEEKFYVHSIILRCQSIYFRTAFSNNFVVKKNEKYFFKISNVASNHLNKIIRFLYCSQIDLTAENGSDILMLLITANEFEMHSLVEHIQECLINDQKEFVQNNVIEVLELTMKHEPFTTLQKFCFEIICQYPNLLFEKGSSVSLSSQILEKILNQNDIGLEEIEIWNNLIKWAYAQNPEINHDPSKWTQEDFNTLKQNIRKFIPLIRFQDISSDDFYDQIFPYEKLLPDELKSDVMKFYLTPNVTESFCLLPSRLTPIDSVIINSRHLAIFASWIEKNNDSHYNLRNNPYNFNLLYHAKIDGNTPNSFHEKCDNKGATIVVAKLSNSEKIVGGYNPQFWDKSDAFKSTNDSFIFSFENRKNLKSAKVGYSKSERYAIFCDPNCGPGFGGGCDLICLNDGNWTSTTHTYPKIGIPQSFNVEDYEIFQVFKI